ncbi:MAG: FKBP-type peptidyl-prolyl cis-trans isomerase [Mycobacteriales bacterium]
MTRHRAALVLLAGASALALVACGSASSDSTGTTGTSPATGVTTAAPQSPPSAVPSTVGADAVPAVTGPQGKKPAIAKPTGPAPTALLVHDVIVGTGATATNGSKVTVQYTGAIFATGAGFQSSYDTGQPFSFPLGSGQVIPGFDAGVVGMKTGGRRELIIPPALGYRNQTMPGIPANSTLIFVIDLVSVG